MVGGGVKGISEADEQMDELVREVNLFALASHLYWAIWALVSQSPLSALPLWLDNRGVDRSSRLRPTSTLTTPRMPTCVCKSTGDSKQSCLAEAHCSGLFSFSSAPPQKSVYLSARGFRMADI